MMKAWDVYAEQLFHFGHGLPLWFPEPGDSGEISIGDVGYIEKGRFYGLFNTMLPDDHKVNKRYGVPEPFECFEVPHNFKRSCPDTVKQDELRSESITPVDVSVGATAQTIVSAGLQFRYKCSNEHGALLRLSQPGHAVAIHCGQSIKDYMRLQHSHWFTFARDVMGLEKQEEDLIFVSGHVKTAEWLLIAEYTSSSREGELSFTGTIGPSASANASLSMSHSVSMSVQYRPGPPKTLSICPDSSISVAANNSAGDDTPASASEKSNFDQCIFLNYYKLKTRRFRAPKIIEAAAGTHEQPRSDDDNDKDSPASISSSDDSFEEVPVCNKMYDPVNYLLDYILGHSEASMAIASDSDFISICKDEDIPIDIPAMLERIAPKIEIDKHGVGTISSNIVRSMETTVFKHEISYPTDHHTPSADNRKGKRSARSQSSGNHRFIQTGSWSFLPPKDVSRPPTVSSTAISTDSGYCSTSRAEVDDSKSGLRSTSTTGRNPSSLSSGSTSRPKLSLKEEISTWYRSKYGGSTRVLHHTSTSIAALRMHPLFACTRIHRAPIAYDVMLTPSARTILDRETRFAIPAHTLSQPATDPPNTTGSRLVLRCDKFPWSVVVGGSQSNSQSNSKRPGVAFDSLALGRGRSGGGVITNLDLLYAVHTTLLTRITQEEWGALGHGSRAQQKVTRAYERRCTRMGGGWEGGVRRIDWLGEKTCLVGVEIDRSSASACTGKLVFGKP